MGKKYLRTFIGVCCGIKARLPFREVIYASFEQDHPSFLKATQWLIQERQAIVSSLTTYQGDIILISQPKIRTNNMSLKKKKWNSEDVKKNRTFYVQSVRNHTSHTLVNLWSSFLKNYLNVIAETNLSPVQNEAWSLKVPAIRGTCWYCGCVLKGELKILGP